MTQDKTEKHEFDKVICELSDWLGKRDAYRDALSSGADKTQFLKILRAIVCPDYAKLQAKVRELEKEVSHLEGVSDGYAVVEMEDKAKIKSLQAELSALKAENEKLKEFERKRWESAVKAFRITPPKPEENKDLINNKENI